MAFVPDKCRIPELMRERNLEPYQVYEHPEIKMKKQQFSAYCTLRNTMSINTLKMFANFFKVPMDDIYTWKEVPRQRGRQ